MIPDITIPGEVLTAMAVAVVSYLLVRGIASVI
jgi:hypothetical protein